MNFLKNLRDIGRSPTARQTKLSPVSADSQNNLILDNFTDLQSENVLSLPCLRSRDKDTTCQSKVGTVCCDRQPVMRAEAPVTGGVRVPVRTNPEILPSWDDIEELEDDVKALKAALRAKDAELKKMCIEVEARIYSESRKPSPSIPCVPMPVPAALSTLPVQFGNCNTESDSTRNMQLLNTLADELAVTKSKFKAMHCNSSRLTQELERSEAMVAALQVSENMAQQLYRQQQDINKSLLASIRMEKKTKFIQGSHKLHYDSTAPTKPVKEEIVKAFARLQKEKRQKQKEDINRLVSIVDAVSSNYSADRYSFKSTIITNPVQMEDEACVTEVFKALCLFSMDTSEEENLEYDEYLQQQVMPPIIYSPDFPKPRVEWRCINTNIHRNLPKPQVFPIHGAAQDPAFYTETTHLCEGELKFHTLRPFGYCSGFRTSCGILPVPDEAINGYKWDEDSRDWVIAAFV